MQTFVSGPFVHTQPHETAKVGIALSRTTPGFVRTVQATIGVFARFPMPVFACAVLLLGGAGLIGSAMYAVLVGQAVMREAWNISTANVVYNVQLIVQAIIGTFTLLLGRGAMTWLALSAETDDTAASTHTLARALHESLRHWQPQLVSTVIYGLLMTGGTLGLTVLLRQLRLDSSNARWLRGDLDSVLNWTMIRSISTLIPDPSSPFAEWIAAAKYNLARTASSGYFSFDYYSRFAAREASLSVWLLGLGSAILLIAGETLLCLRTAAIFAAPQAKTATGWLPQTLRLGWRSFRRLSVWRWMLRIGIALLTTITLVLLPALHQMTIMNQIRQAIGTGYWPYYIAQAGYGFVGAMIGGILLAFSIGFEARAYLALQHADTPTGASSGASA